MPHAIQLWLNGALVNDDEARVSATSAGLLLGWGAFTTMGVFAGRPFLLEKHLARLRRDCNTLDLELPFSDDELRAGLSATLHANNIQNGMARLTVTARGDGRWNTDTGCDVTILARAGEPNLRPATLWLSPIRVGSNSALASIKSTSYAAHLLAWHSARSHDCDDALLLSEDGSVCEASRANIFWVKNGELFTPSLWCGCLPGIAREWVVMQHKARTAHCTLNELREADEVFVTASTFGARPVRAMYDGDGEVRWTESGETTRKMMQAWQEAVENQRDFS